jgi:hypothetical protein
MDTIGLMRALERVRELHFPISGQALRDLIMSHDVSRTSVLAKFSHSRPN